MLIINRSELSPKEFRVSCKSQFKVELLLRILWSRDNSDRLGANAKMQLNVVSAPRHAGNWSRDMYMYYIDTLYIWIYFIVSVFFRACFACFACIFAVIFGICHSQVMIFFVYRLNRGGRLSNLKLINCKTPNYARFYLVTELNCFTYAHRLYTGSYLECTYIWLFL